MRTTGYRMRRADRLMLAPHPAPAARVVFDMDGLMLDTGTSPSAAGRSRIDDQCCVRHGIAPLDDRAQLRDSRNALAHYGADYPIDALMRASRTQFDAIAEREGIAMPGACAADWLGRLASRAPSRRPGAGDRAPRALTADATRPRACGR